MSGIFEDTYNMAITQIATSNRNLSKEYSAELMYRISKMETIMADSLEEFRLSGRISQNNLKTINLNTLPTRTLLANIVNSLTTLESQKNKITDEKIMEDQIQKAKWGNFFDSENILDLKIRYDINTNYISLERLKGVTEDLAYSNFVLKEDFDNGLQWDNTASSIVLRKIFDEHVQKSSNKKEMEETAEITIITDEMLEKKEEGIFSKFKNGLKNIFTKFQNRKLKQLEAPSIKIENGEDKSNNNTSKKSSDYFSKYRVDPNSINHEFKIEKTENDLDIIKVNEINFD